LFNKNNQLNLNININDEIKLKKNINSEKIKKTENLLNIEENIKIPINIVKKSSAISFKNCMKN